MDDINLTLSPEDFKLLLQSLIHYTTTVARLSLETEALGISKVDNPYRTRLSRIESLRGILQQQTPTKPK